MPQNDIMGKIIYVMGARPEVKAALAAVAERNHRSQSAQALAYIEAGLMAERATGIAMTAARESGT